MNNQVTLFIADEAHVTLGVASTYTSLIFLCNMLSKLASGPIYDGAHGRVFAVAACGTLTVGCLLLLHLSWTPSVSGETLTFAILFGIGYGGGYSLIQSRAALHFGHRRGFKTVQGFLSAGQYAGMTCGYFIPPLLAHAFSYSVSFSALCGSAVTSLLAIVAFELREASLSSVAGGPASLNTPFLPAGPTADVVVR